MPLQLVRDAIEQSRTREPLVNVMALLTGARVLAYMDLAAAKQAFEEALSTFEQLSLDARITQSVRHEIIQIAVPVDPEIAVTIYKQLERNEWFPSDGRALISALAVHGFATIALDLLEDLSYPIEGASSLIHARQDKAFQLRVLRAARARWHPPRHSWMLDESYRLFSGHFRIVAEGEATAWLDELLLRVKTMPTDRISARFSDSVLLETFADMHIFQLLNVLRALKPPTFVEALLSQYPGVAAAAKDYPNGTESIEHPAGPRPTIFPRLIPIEQLLDEAHLTYINDVDSNAAPRVLWPSGQAYTRALYWAGDRFGIAGAHHLNAIPDPDLAIRGGIGLAAGVLGISMHAGAGRFIGTSPAHQTPAYP